MACDGVRGWGMRRHRQKSAVEAIGLQQKWAVPSGESSRRALRRVRVPPPTATIFALRLAPGGAWLGAVPWHRELAACTTTQCNASQVFPRGSLSTSGAFILNRRATELWAGSSCESHFLKEGHRYRGGERIFRSTRLLQLQLQRQGPACEARLIE